MNVAALLMSAIAHFTLTPDFQRQTVHVELTVTGWDGDCLCMDMGGAEMALTGLSPHPRQESCFVRPTRDPIAYTVSLESLRQLHDDPDYATRLGDAWVVHDASLLLRPDGKDMPLQVQFVLPAGHSVATPWVRRDDGEFHVSVAQFQAGSYLAMGPGLRKLTPVQFNTFSAQLTLLDSPRAATDAQLHQWVSGALTSLAAFYRGSPTTGVQPIHIIMASVPHEDPGVFGSVRREGEPSVLLLFGDRATRGFEADWVATHELFHLGNPLTRAKFPWFIEGFTTYYTQLLRARSGAITPAQAWGTLATSFREFCQPQGESLAWKSRNLRETHEWMRVYWGGACLALRLDVAIRQRSNNRRSLDDVMRELRARKQALSEKDVIGALDAAAGQALASTHLNTTTQIPIEQLLTDLGIGEATDEAAVLRPKSRWSAMRESMSRGVQ
jgi:hypothetical protein